jgi:hypothetical protein
MRMARLGLSISAVVLGLAGISGCSGETRTLDTSAAPIDFNWHIRPILSDKCFQCHGPDEGSLKAGLRLDDRMLATSELPESPGLYAIVPGDPEASQLVSRINAENVDERMPPAESHKSLSEEEKKLLAQWIAEGAMYKPHWSYITPSRPEVPTGGVDGNNTIDGFIRQKLAVEGIESSEEAAREALINRVSLTLTGLPPSLAAVDAFLADDGDQAYENLVDQLLASPRYGEHMAAYWMDLARWSESDGFLDDHHDRFLWPWRDWVIGAFNDNMSYDQFATWQLAGDLLPDPGREQLLATTFVRLGKRTTENGAIAAEYEAEYRAERTDNLIGTTFLGLTMGCARCHDHKYDPITQQGYYSIAAFFNNSDEPGVYAPGFSGIQGGPTLPWPNAEMRESLDEALEGVAQQESRYRTVRATALEEAEPVADMILSSATGLGDLLATAVDRNLAAYYSFDSVDKAGLTDLPVPKERRVPPATINGLEGGPYAAPGKSDNETPEQRREREFRELQGRVPRNYIADQLYLSPAAGEDIPDAVIQDPVLRDGVKGQALFFNETNKGFLGRDIGWYDRSEPFSIDFWFYVAEDYDDVTLLNHMSEQNSGTTGYQLAIREGKLWVSLAHSPPANMIALESRQSLPVARWSHITLAYDGSSSAAGTLLYLDGLPLAMDVDHDSLTRSMLPWGTGDVFDPFVGLAFGTRFRVKAPVGSGLDEVRVYDRALNPLEVAYLHEPTMPGNFAEADVQAHLVELLASHDDRVRQAQLDLMASRQAGNDIATAIPQVLVMGTSPNHDPTHVLNRGLYSEPGEEVAARGLDFVLPWREDLPQNRLGLARWLFDPENPLTARVFVNRIWQMHFGHGLVETSEDFGSQGAIPSHPELLDWLAVEFIESGWDIKALHRLIVTSATYRQDSGLNAGLLESDPGNVLYARGPRWRMTAEMIRDQALFVSEALDDTIGGPSAMPYQPEAIWNPLNSFYTYADPGAAPVGEHRRRTLYNFIKRNALHPALGIFDFKNRTESIARRRTSNTPLQALALMNDPQYVEAYRLMAENVMRNTSEDNARLQRLYRLVMRQAPDAAELGILERYYHDQLAYFSENRERAAALLTVGVIAADESLEDIELAALTNVASVIMNAPDAYILK